jgi:ABC-2 type transport system ATP-binding protein
MIQINGITKCYGSQTALKNLSLEINDGQVIGILGENGAGKTTLLKAIAGLTSLDDGEITYIDITTNKERSEKIAFMTEEGSFFPFMTAKENALFLTDYYPKFNMERFEKLCDFLVIPMNKAARTFSKGQKAKLEIALGFSKGAKYLLLDEPFLGNDIFTRRNFLKLMCDSLITDETIVIATHMIDEIENFIDRAVLLENGQLIEDVSIEDLQSKHQSLEELMKEAFHYDEDRFKNMFYNG